MVVHFNLILIFSAWNQQIKDKACIALIYLINCLCSKISIYNSKMLDNENTSTIFNEIRGDLTRYLIIE